MKLAFVRSWGCDLPRSAEGFDSVVLSRDPSVVYVLGNIGGAGLLRSIDSVSGQQLRDSVHPLFLKRGGRVVASCVTPDNAVLVAVSIREGARIVSIALDTRETRGVIDLPWVPRTVEHAPNERLLVDQGVWIDLKTGSIGDRDTPRWCSPDKPHEVVETDLQRRGDPHVRLTFTIGQEAPWSTNAVRFRGTSGVFSPDGAYFWRLGGEPEGGFDNAQDRWETSTGKREPRAYLPFECDYVAVRADGADPLVCRGDGRLVDESSVASAVQAGARWSPVAPCVSPDGARFAYIREGVVHEIDLRSGQSVSRGGHSGAVASVALSPRGDRLAVGGNDGDITYWDVDTGEQRWRLEGGAGAVVRVHLSPDARLLHAVIESIDRMGLVFLRSWDLTQGSEITQEPLCFKRDNRVWWSPDGASAVIDAHPPMWVDLHRGRSRRFTHRDIAGSKPARAEGPRIYTQALFSSDGATVQLFCPIGRRYYKTDVDAHTGEILKNVETRGNEAFPQASETPLRTADWTAVSNEPTGVTLTAKGGRTASFATSSRVSALCASDDGERIAAAMTDGGIMVWKVIP